MITIKNGNIQNTPCRIGRIEALAYDGCEFAMLAPNQKGVVRLDEDLCPIETLSTCHKYRCICFDTQEHCYWAISDQSPTTIFMLDKYFYEINANKYAGTNSQRPLAMSCSPCTNTIIILYQNSIVYVDKRDGCHERIPFAHNELCNYDILALSKGHILASHQERKYAIDIHDNQGDCPVHFCIPDGFSLEAMYIINICEDDPHCTTYDINLVLCDFATRETCILPILITSCSEECECPSTPPSCQSGIFEIMHSIALEEAGIAHILNAEGEKIQKAVASDISIEDLLRVNDSVSCTISKVTLLEGQLIAKLESVLCFQEDHNCSECSCEDCDDDCD